MTNGGFAAIAVTLRAILEPGDEVVFLSPPWFFYELLILAAGGEPVRVGMSPPEFELDLDALMAAFADVDFLDDVISEEIAPYDERGLSVRDDGMERLVTMTLVFAAE